MRAFQVSNTAVCHVSHPILIFLLAFFTALSSEGQNMNPPMVGPEIVLPTGHASNIRAIAFSPDGRWLASGGDDGTLQIWDVKSHRVWRTMGTQGGQISSIAFEPDSRRLVIAVRATQIGWIMHVRNTHVPKGNAIRMFDIVTGKPLWNIDYPFDITSIALDSDGHLLASAGNDKRVRVWNAEQGSLIHNLSAGARGWMNCVAISPDGRLVASAGPRKIKIWNTSEGKLLATLSGHTKGTFTLAFSPDGQWLVSGGGDHRVKLWDMTKKREAGAWSLRGIASTVAFTSDGSWLAWNDSFLDDRQILITKISVLDFKAQRPALTLDAYRNSPVSTIVFKQNGKQLAVAGWGGRIELWDPSAGTYVEFSMRGAPKNDLALDKSGRWLITGGGLVEVWDTYSDLAGPCGPDFHNAFSGKDFALLAADISSDGKFLSGATGSIYRPGTTMYIWQRDRL